LGLSRISSINRWHWVSVSRNFKWLEKLFISESTSEEHQKGVEKTREWDRWRFYQGRHSDGERVHSLLTTKKHGHPSQREQLVHVRLFAQTFGSNKMDR
jgi:hypothetical protein